MTGIIDIHTHILPGVDDGASNIKESLRMARIAYQQGITDVIATPHYSAGFRNVSPDHIRALCREVREKASAEIKREFRVWPGQELLYSEEILEMLEQKKLLTMADSRYVLVEFLPSVPYSYIFRAAKELLFAGYYPIIAHAERYQALRKNARIEELKEQGVYIQINFRPVGGKWYNETTRWCRKQFREGKVDFVGTDMHNISSRRPETSEALAWMKRSLDGTYLRDVLRGNVQKLLSDKKI